MIEEEVIDKKEEWTDVSNFIIFCDFDFSYFMNLQNRIILRIQNN